MKVLVIDNYDSFTFNLVHYLEDLNCEVAIMRNDKIQWDKLNSFHKILLSPGPGLPDEAGNLKHFIKEYATTKSILGICLGMQAIGEVFGAKLLNLEEVYHGSLSWISIIDSRENLYYSLEDKIQVGRYHSWVVDREDFPNELEITAIDEQGTIMSLKHKLLDVKGVQFHPESILTPEGKKMLENWVFNT